MIPVLAAEFAFFTGAILLLYIAHLIDADDTRTVPDGVEHGAFHHTHPCWAEYDPALLAANGEAVAAEMAAVRAQIPAGRQPIGHGFVVGHRKLVAAR